MPKQRQLKKTKVRVLEILNKARSSQSLPPINEIPKGDSPYGKNKPYLCPICRSLDVSETGVDYVQVRTEAEAQSLCKVFNSDYNEHPQNGYEVGLPTLLIHFIRMYDRGLYPELIN